MGYRIINGNLYPVGNFPEGVLNNQKINRKNSTSFENILKNEIKKDVDFTISNHAAKRLESRNIKLSKLDMENINKGINMAKKKGSKDSVIIYKDIALVTSIKNRTIITAVNKNESKNNIFTNIDSIVML